MKHTIHELEPLSWSIVGARNIGLEFIETVAKEGVYQRLGLVATPDSVLRKDGWHERERDGKIVEDDPLKMPDSDVLIVASSSTTDNEPMLSLMNAQLGAEKIVVTAEKSTIAYNFSALKSLPGKLGYWATAGGGNRMLPSLKLFTHDEQNIQELHIMPNGTLTDIFGEVQSGTSPIDAVAQAKEKGFAEPNGESEVELIRLEANIDVSRKTSIIWNTIFPYLDNLPPDNMCPRLENEEIMTALDGAEKYRYIVSLYPETSESIAEETSEDRLGGFKLYHEGWLIVAGLQRVDRENSLASFANSKGPNAGFAIKLGPRNKPYVSDGTYTALGEGAGASATVNAMQDNLIAIRRGEDFLA